MDIVTRFDRCLCCFSKKISAVACTIIMFVSIMNNKVNKIIIKNTINKKKKKIILKKKIIYQYMKM